MPLFASLFAWLTLDASEEAMGLIAWGGAALMLSASVVASAAPKKPVGLEPSGSSSLLATS